MKKILLTSLLIAGLSFAQASQNFVIEKGSVTFSDGKKLFSEDGNIIYGVWSDKDFIYAVSLNNNIIFKSLNGSFNKTISTAYVKFYNDGYFATSNNPPYYDNIWHIENGQIKLMNKNITLPGNAYEYYDIKSYFDSNGFFAGYNIVDIRTGMSIPEQAKINKDRAKIIGVINDSTIVTLKLVSTGFFSGNYTLEAYNTKTGNVITLASEENIKHGFQLLISPNKQQAVIKVFNEDNTEENEYRTFRTKELALKVGTYIDVTTGKNIKINENEFKLVTSDKHKSQFNYVCYSLSNFANDDSMNAAIPKF